jgi:hypothetical protein
VRGEGEHGEVDRAVVQRQMIERRRFVGRTPARGARAAQ